MDITGDIKYVGVNDHEIDLFEGMYEVPKGMAYNSYVILDKKIAIIDTVDVEFKEQWLLKVKEVLEIIAKSLVENPDEVTVSEIDKDGSLTLELRVADGDMGKVIGKQGRIAKAIRTIAKSASIRMDERVMVEID